MFLVFLVRLILDEEESVYKTWLHLQRAVLVERTMRGLMLEEERQGSVETACAYEGGRAISEQPLLGGLGVRLMKQ